MHLNYGDNDFVVDLDSIWKYIGFTRIDNAKALLKKNFTKDSDYIVCESAPAIAGGIQIMHENNKCVKEKIMMTIDTCKKLCMKAGTKKSDEVINYYVKLEKVS